MSMLPEHVTVIEKNYAIDLTVITKMTIESGVDLCHIPHISVLSMPKQVHALADVYVDFTQVPSLMARTIDRR